MNPRNTVLLAILGVGCLSASAVAQEAPSEPAPPPEDEMEMFDPDAPEEGASGDIEASGEVEASASMDAEMSISAPASSDEEVSWQIGIAPRIGVAVPTSTLSPFVVFGLELGYRLPGMESISIVGDFSYTKPGHSDEVNDPRAGGAAGFEVDESEIKLGLGGNYRIFSDAKSLIPWVGAGFIMQRLTTSETNDLAPGENTSSDTRFGGEFSAGVDFKLGMGYLLGEARMVLTDLNDLITGNSNAGNVNLGVGYRIVL